MKKGTSKNTKNISDKNKTQNTLSSNGTKTSGQIGNDYIPAKDKSPDDMEIIS